MSSARRGVTSKRWSHSGTGVDGADNNQLPLFAAAAAPEALPDPLREALAALAPDEMTPRAALDAIYRLRKLLE